MFVISKEQSERICCIKGISIFTVFFAHMPWSGDNPIVHKLFCLLGIIGVPIFLFLSGYLDAGSHSTIMVKIKRLFIPLVLWATIMYILRYLITGSLGCWDYLRWVLGSGSIYYFVPLLLICILLSKICNRYVLIALSITSISLSWDYIPHNEIITRYLNPFNFVLYFELGKLARSCPVMNIGTRLSLVFSFLTMFFVGVLWPSEEPCYFSFLCIPFVFAAFVFIDCCLKIYPAKFLIPIGKYSFVIYLSHILIAGIINGRMHGYLEYVKVPVAFIVVLFVVSSINKFLNTIDDKHKLLGWLGYR